jgi:hypothetical protein
MPYFLMKEEGDEFWCQADDVAEARENAAIFNAVVLRQATRKEQTFLEEESK